MQSATTPTAQNLGQPTLGFTYEFKHLSDSYFERLASARGLKCRTAITWATEARYVDHLKEPTLFTIADRERPRTAIMELEGCLARVQLLGGQMGALLAADDQAALNRAVNRLRQEFPEPEISPDEPRVSFTFNWAGAYGSSSSMARTLDVVRWEDVRGNYTSSTAAQLKRLATDFRPGRSGQTVIWHGEPGTGKTNALRALAFEWRDWCDFTIVTDPDQFFGSNASYLMNVLSQDGPDPDRWRAILLEDAGELLCGDARSYVGQGLSRFLNVCDGLLGQVQNVLLLVTTNEPLKRLHPAVTRPGRCAAEVEFNPLDVKEANAWLATRGSVRVTRPTSLAELYGLVSDAPLPKVEAQAGPIGFGSAIKRSTR